MSVTVPLNGTFWRISFAAYLTTLLDGVRHPEGRFHHSGQPAFYASPTEEAAGLAVARYVERGDPPRVISQLCLRDAKVCDLRDPRTVEALAIDPDTPSVPWAEQRKNGLPATSWQASDAARNAGADGMIYTSRTEPSRWHLVLFRWNKGDGARLQVTGPATPWTSNKFTGVIYARS